MKKLNIFNKKSTEGGKLFTLLAAFIMLLIVTSSTSARADGGYDFVSGNLQYKITSETEGSKTVELVGYDGDEPSGELIIPATVTNGDKEYSVTVIGNEAFYYCTSLTSVTIPEGVTSIGEGAFSDCTSLTSVTIPKSVTSIGDYAFIDVRHIINKSKCTAPDHWGARAENGTVDGDFIYEDDTKTNLLVYIGKGGEVTIPDGVTAIGKSAFDACTSLTSVTIPEGVTSIGDYAFIDCSSLTSVTIPNSVKSIGSDAFFACHTLHVTIPNSVTSIEGESTFLNVKHIINQSSCTNDRHWGAIAENGIVDGDFVYENDTKTTLLAYIGKGEEVTIPSGVTSIGNGAFLYCTSLTSVTIPNSVTSIGDCAFSDCTSLTSVTIPNSVTSIGDGAFGNCSSLTSVTIPNGVTSIGEAAFCECTSLTSVTIPESVTSIGDYAFAEVKHIINKSNCTDPDHWGAFAENGTVVGDFVYENDTKTTLLAYIGKDKEVTIPSGVTSIGKNAIRECTSLTSVIIPDGVTSIGEAAFCECTSLTSVTIPESVTSIGDYAFIGCTSLTSVTIPESVTSIGERAFFNCKSLTSVTIPEGVTSIGDYAFNYCKSVENVYLYANPDNLTWSEGGCDDFITNPKGATKCHVPVEYFTNYTTKFKDKVNVTFVGDVIQLTADDITTSQISDVTYTGTPFTPEIEVKYGDKTLEAGTDYTITYSNNTNAGTAKATITGIKLLAFTKEVEFTIAPAPVTVSAEAKSKTFGESDPEFTATVSGLVNNESPDLITYTLTRTEGENVGEYTITAKGDEKQGNYEVTFVDGKLTINENPNTPVSSIDNNGNNVKVWSYARTIYIASTPDSQYKIIDLQGRTIATSTTTSSLEQININKSGILVVIINGKSYKVSL